MQFRIKSNGDEKTPSCWKTFLLLALVVQRADNALHWINHSPVDSAVSFVISYPLDNDLSVGYRYPPFEQLDSDVCFSLRCGWFASKIFVFLSGYRSYFCFIQKGEWNDAQIRNFNWTSFFGKAGITWWVVCFPALPNLTQSIRIVSYDCRSPVFFLFALHWARRRFQAVPPLSRNVCQ